MERMHGTGIWHKVSLLCSLHTYRLLLRALLSPKSGSFLDWSYGFWEFIASLATKSSGTFVLMAFCDMASSASFAINASNYHQTPTIRFVLPVLPVALMFSGYSLAKLGRAEISKGDSNPHIRRAPKLELAVLFLLITNVPMALYMSMIHQVRRCFCHWGWFCFYLLTSAVCREEPRMSWTISRRRPWKIMSKAYFF